MPPPPQYTPRGYARQRTRATRKPDIRVRATTPDHERHRTRGYLLAALAAVCWAAGGLTAKWLFSSTGITVEPSHLAAARAFIAFLMLLAYLAVTRRDALKVGAKDLPFLACFGVFGLAAVHFTYFAAIVHTNVPTAILLEYLAPILVLAISVAFMGERLTWALPAGTVLSITGCGLVVGVLGGSGLKVSPQGIAWGLAAAVFFAAYTLMGKHAAGRYSPWTLLVYGLGAASVFWLIYLAVRGETGAVVTLLSSPVRATAVVGMALGATVIPFAAYLSALTYIEATSASITATLEPVVAAAATYAIPALYEPLTPLQWLGGLLVLAAVVVVQVPGRMRTAVPPPT